MTFFNLSFQEEKVLSESQFKGNSLSWNKIFHSALKYPAKSSVSKNIFPFRTSGQKGKGFLMGSIDVSFPLPCVGTLLGGGLREQSPSAWPLPRTSPQGSHFHSPIHSLNKMLPKLQPWQAPGLSVGADDELRCTGCQAGQWTGRWCKNADEEGWTSAEMNQLLQQSCKDVVATMAINAWSVVCYCFSWGKPLVEGWLAPLHPSSWRWRFFKMHMESGCWGMAGCLTALVVNF